MPRLVLPLVRVILGASPDEQHLVEKTSSIIRQRISDLKVFPDTFDSESLKKDLEELHNIARKASHQQVSPTMLSSSNIYISKALIHGKCMDTVVAVHQGSLADFLNRKGSKISHTLFTDFIKRIPVAAWAIREDLIQACGSERPAHPFRQTQAINWTDKLLLQVFQVVRVSGHFKFGRTYLSLQPTATADDIVRAAQMIREITYRAMQSSLDDTNSVSVAQTKALVKMALQAISVTKRVAPQKLPQVWNIAQFHTLLGKVQSSQSLNEAGGLKVLMGRMASKLDESNKEKDLTPTKGKKRKAINDSAIEEGYKKKKPKVQGK